MKRLVVLFFILCSFELYAKAQTMVFTYNEKGNIVSCSKFIEPFDQGLGLDKYTNLTYRKAFSADVSTVSGAMYKVEGLRLDGYGWEGEPGDYHLIRIEKDGNEIFEQICILGWIYFPDDLPSSNVADRRFFVYPLKDNSLALFFVGQSCQVNHSS